MTPRSTIGLRSILLLGLLALLGTRPTFATPKPGYCGGTGGTYIVSTSGFTVDSTGGAPAIPDHGYALGCYDPVSSAYRDYTPGVLLKLGTIVNECTGTRCPESEIPCAPDVAAALTESLRCHCSPGGADGLHVLSVVPLPRDFPNPQTFLVGFAINYTLLGPTDPSVYIMIANPDNAWTNAWPIGPSTSGSISFAVTLPIGLYKIQLTGRQTMCGVPALSEGETENYNLKLTYGPTLTPRVKLWGFGEPEPVP